MGTTFRFLGVNNDAELVVDWFRRLPTPPEEARTAKGLTLYFRDMGALALEADGSGRVDARRSPLVTLILPRKTRGVLWTAGEVHFLATPLRKTFHKLHAVSREFGAWLAGHPLVFSRATTGQCEWNYYLEGSIRNYDSDLYAMPSAMEALRSGQYFVADDDTEEVIDRLCRSLRLRGVEGITEM